jgi:leucyl aminopeptidase
MLHPSSNTDDSTVNSTGTVDPKHNSASTKSPPPMDRQSSVSKIAQVAKHLVKSPAEEVEHKQLEKTLNKEAKKGEVDVSVMEA